MQHFGNQNDITSKNYLSCILNDWQALNTDSQLVNTTDAFI